jgi:hypothetical protein
MRPTLLLPSLFDIALLLAAVPVRLLLSWVPFGKKNPVLI